MATDAMAGVLAVSTRATTPDRWDVGWTLRRAVAGAASNDPGPLSSKDSEGTCCYRRPGHRRDRRRQVIGRRPLAPRRTALLSLLLVEHVARVLAESRLLVVGTYRDVEVSRRHPLSDTLAELISQPITSRLVLRGLSEAEVAHCIAAVTREYEPLEMVMETNLPIHSGPQSPLMNDILSTRGFVGRYRLAMGPVASKGGGYEAA
jgi:hypothetical protein